MYLGFETIQENTLYWMFPLYLYEDPKSGIHEVNP